MGFYIDRGGGYYEGDRQSLDDTSVSQRPSYRFSWENGEWVIGPPIALEMKPLDFLDLFTEQEQIGVVTATLANPAIKLFYDRLLAATYVTIEDPRTLAGIQALVSAGLLTQARADAVIAAMYQP